MPPDTEREDDWTAGFCAAIQLARECCDDADRIHAAALQALRERPPT